MTADELIGQVKFDDRGLVPVVTQDAGDNVVLMVAWANAEAIRNSFTQRHATYWSRSRKSLWVKAKRRGISRTWRRSSTTADVDTLLYRVRQTGAACHTGTDMLYRSGIPARGKTE